MQKHSLREKKGRSPEEALGVKHRRELGVTQPGHKEAAPLRANSFDRLRRFGQPSTNAVPVNRPLRESRTNSWHSFAQHQRSESGSRNMLLEAQRHLQNWSEQSQAAWNSLTEPLINADSQNPSCRIISTEASDPTVNMGVGQSGPTGGPMLDSSADTDSARSRERSRSRQCIGPPQVGPHAIDPGQALKLLGIQPKRAAAPAPANGAAAAPTAAAPSAAAPSAAAPATATTQSPGPWRCLRCCVPAWNEDGAAASARTGSRRPRPSHDDRRLDAKPYKHVMGTVQLPTSLELTRTIFFEDVEFEAGFLKVLCGHDLEKAAWQRDGTPPADSSAGAGGIGAWRQPMAWTQETVGIDPKILERFNVARAYPAVAMARVAELSAGEVVVATMRIRVPDAPFGNAFAVNSKWVLRAAPGGRTTATNSFEMSFLQPILVAPIIEMVNYHRARDVFKGVAALATRLCVHGRRRPRKSSVFS